MTQDRKEQIRRYLQHLNYIPHDAVLDQHSATEQLIEHIDQLMEQNGWRVERAFRVAVGHAVPASPPLNESDRRLHRRVVAKLATSKVGNKNEAIVDEVFQLAKELGGDDMAIVSAIGVVETRWATNIAAAEEIDPSARLAARSGGLEISIPAGVSDEVLRLIIDHAISQSGVELPADARATLEDMLMGRAHRRSVEVSSDSGEVWAQRTRHGALRERLESEAFAAGVTLAMAAAKLYKRTTPALNRVKGLLFDPNPHDALVVADYALRFASAAYVLIYLVERQKPGAYWNLVASLGMSLAASQARRMAQQAAVSGTYTQEDA